MPGHARRPPNTARAARGRRRGVWIAAAALLLAGCGEWLPQLQQVLGLGGAPAALVAGTSNVQSLAFYVTPEDEYQVLELGPGRAGDEWTLQVADETGRVPRAALVLLDERYNLLRRVTLEARTTLQHVLCNDENRLYAGIMLHGTSPVTVRITAAAKPAEAPAPRPQLIWLNFDGATGLVIHGRAEAACAPFDAEVLGEAYVGQTEVIATAVLETLRELYADYDVEFLSSAVDAVPTEEHATIHFGGSNAERLGFSDGVDWGNADPCDEAVVYVGNLTAYESMRLSPAEMGRLIGTVAGHEAGHLLGLCHTRGATALMDESRNAWALVGTSSFDAAPVAPTVFPIGMLDAAAVLARTVGLRAVDRQ